MDERTGAAAAFVGRTWILDVVDSWRRAGDTRHLLIVGPPGWGKTAVAHWLTDDDSLPPEPDAARKLTALRAAWAATHFCEAGDTGAALPGRFTEHLAEQLARDPGYAEALINATRPVNASIRIQTGPVSGTVNAVRQLFLGQSEPERAYEQAIRAPLIRLERDGADAARLILVDALDESLAVDGRTTVASLLAKSGDLPRGVRFVLTTRPDRRILDTFRKNTRVVDLRSPEYAKLMVADLHEYVTRRLAGFGRGEDDVRRLMATAGSNFLYARWVLDEIGAGRRTDLTTLPEGLNGLYREFLARLIPEDTDTWINQYEPLLGCLTVADPAAPDRNLPGWLDWQRTAVTWRLREISQLVESGADPPDGELGHRLYHRSITEFLAEYEYRDTEGLWQNLYFVDPAVQHERLVSYYLGKLAKDWNGNWGRCDGYGLRRLVSHLRSRWELARNDTAGAAEDLYRVALDPGFQNAQRDRTGGVHTSLNSLRTCLEVALEQGRGDLVPALRAAAAFRALTATESLSRAVFTAVAARDLPMAVQKMTHYTTGPEATGGWPALLQLYLAWEAAEAGALEEMTDLVAQAGAYPSALADALLAGTAQAAARHAHDAGHWLSLFRRDEVSPFVAQVTWNLDVTGMEEVVRQLEVAAAGEAHNPLRDPEGMTDLVIDIQDDLRAMIATGAAHQLLERAVAAAVRNPYPRYRDTALQALGTAALAATDHGWTARQLQQILRAGLDDEGVTFTFDLPALLVAAGERRSLRMPALSRYLDEAAAARDAWGTRLRALSAQAAAAHRLGDTDRAAELLIDGSREETTYAGYGVTAALALDDRCHEIGRPDLADAPRWGNQGDLTLSQLAGNLAGRVYDPLFSVERMNLVRAHREWRSAPVPEPDAVAERLAQLPDRDARAAYRNHVAARWSADPATAAQVRTLVPGALFDTTGLDGLLARVVGAALPELTDDHLRDLAELVSDVFTTGRPWLYAQWR